MSKRAEQFREVFDREWNKRFKLVPEPKKNSPKSYEQSKKEAEPPKERPGEDSHRPEKNG